MEMKFPKDYPMSPPFARVVKPRFQFLTGAYNSAIIYCVLIYCNLTIHVHVCNFPMFCIVGHITVGGSVCMEVLTKSGWTPTNDIEVNIRV